MKITAIEVHDHDAAFKAGKYVMSHVVQSVLPIRTLRLTTEDGAFGFGECARSPKIDSVAMKPVEAGLLHRLVGRDVADLLTVAEDMRALGKDYRGLAFALETAFYDRAGRLAELPLGALLGGRRSAQADDYLSISGETADFVVADTKRRFDGQRVVQIKLGVDQPEDDIACVEAVLDFLGPATLLLADFNGALRLEEAKRVLPAVVDPRLIWEEPCLSFEDNCAVVEATGGPVMFDQCVDSLDRIAAVCAGGFAKAVAIKPAFLGGLRMAASARDLCIVHGLSVRIDGPWCGEVASLAALHIALGAPPEQLIASCDLRQPTVIIEDFGGIQHHSGHRISVSDRPGLGITPPDSWFSAG